jgi:endonuclease-3
MASKNINTIFKILEKTYPDFKTELNAENPFQLLIAVILSAQCTDARVNLVTPHLFEKYPDAFKLAKAFPADVERIIHSCGFYKAKTKSIIGTSQILASEYNGELPDDLDKLTKLKGVGRKSASVILNQVFKKPAIAVDTHVKRVAFRLHWTKNTDPLKVEMDLRKLIPIEHWTFLNGRVVLLGRYICKARKPLCRQCPISNYCPSKEL